jgi:predicted RNA-binding protein with PIN domain
VPVPLLVVDAMNVIGSRPDGWWRDRDGAVRRLLGRLQDLAASTPGEQIVLVADGRPLRDVPEGAHDGVHVLYARRGGANAADDRIVEVLEALGGEANNATVVTSDRELMRRVTALGASTVGARTLLTRLDALDSQS